jgi:hypothetical protein
MKSQRKEDSSKAWKNLSKTSNYLPVGTEILQDNTSKNPVIFRCFKQFCRKKFFLLPPENIEKLKIITRSENAGKSCSKL